VAHVRVLHYELPLQRTAGNNSVRTRIVGTKPFTGTNKLQPAPTLIASVL
jgi:hypothetical protein